MLTETRFATHIASLRWDALDQSARHAVKRLLADAVGCIAAGLASPECRRMTEMHVAQGGAAEASIAGHEGRLPASAAAFLNAAAGHWYEWDDVHDASALHPGIVIWPVLLATSEAAGMNGGGSEEQDILAAGASAYDVAVALGMGMKSHLVTGWMPTGIACTIAAAGAAMRLRGGDEDAILSAMGIAASGVGLSRQPLDARVNGKNVLCALAASRAMEAVSLALCGVNGASDYLDGPFGVVRLATGGRLSALPQQHLSPGQAALETSIKPFPSCRSTHPAVDLALRFHREMPGIAGKVDRIDIEVPRPMAELCGSAFAADGDTRVAAQFSIAYCVAVALTRGDLNLGDFVDGRIKGDDAVLALAARIAVEGYDLTPGAPILGSNVQMTVQTSDGARHPREDHRISGSPALPLDDAALEAKFLDCFSGVASAAQAARLYASLAAFDTVEPGEMTASLRALSRNTIE